MKRLLVIVLALIMVMPCSHASAKVEDVDDLNIYIDIPQEGDSFDNATKLEIKEISTVYMSVLETETENDYFKFKVPYTGKYEIFTSGINTTSTTASLYNSTKNEISIDLLDAGEGNFTFSKTLKEGKWYYLKISSPDNVIGDYCLNIVMPFDEDKASNTINGATELVGQQYFTTIDYIGDYDCYVLNIEKSGAYIFSSRYFDEGIDPEMILWKNNEIIAWDWDSGKDKNFDLTTFLKKGRYVIQIYSSGNSGTIDFSIFKREKTGRLEK